MSNNTNCFQKKQTEGWKTRNQTFSWSCYEKTNIQTHTLLFFSFAWWWIMWINFTTLYIWTFFLSFFIRHIHTHTISLSLTHTLSTISHTYTHRHTHTLFHSPYTQTHTLSLSLSLSRSLTHTHTRTLSSFSIYPQMVQWWTAGTPQANNAPHKWTKEDITTSEKSPKTKKRVKNVFSSKKLLSFD